MVFLIEPKDYVNNKGCRTKFCWVKPMYGIPCRQIAL